MAMRETFINPIGRAFSVLSAFSPHERWLNGADIAARTDLPVSTVLRILKSLVNLGYVHQCSRTRRYRLTALVLSLGYAAIAYSEAQFTLTPAMRSLSEQHGLYVVLGTRDRLDVVLLECVNPRPEQSRRTGFRLRISAGTRFDIGESPLGWALLASLPDLERNYLSMKIEQRKSHDWPRIRRKLIDAENVVRQRGYCMSLGEIDPDISIVAAPLMLPEHGPMVIACLGETKNMSRSRVERELGPLLARIESSTRDGGQFAE
ncbi:IclR family transcriptional regulator [Orrella marina]|nr:IclR family transcriptional regulator [Orrella marina]